MIYDEYMGSSAELARIYGCLRFRNEILVELFCSGCRERMDVLYNVILRHLITSNVFWSEEKSVLIFFY